MTSNLQSLIERWCKELLPVVRSSWQLNLTDLPVRVVQRGPLNAVVEGTREAPRISISESLIKTLHTFNTNIVAIGWKMLFEGDPMLSATERLMNETLALVFSMDPPSKPAPAVAARFVEPAFKDSRSQYEEEARVALRSEGAAFLKNLALADPSAAEDLHLLVDPFSVDANRVHLIECQTKFLVLHELAHAALGHLDQPADPEQELQADRLATQLYLSFSRSFRGTGELVIDPAALVILLSALGFVEDLIQLVDRSIEYAIPSGLRQAHRPILRTHPCVRRRAAAITRELRHDGFAYFISHLSERAIYEIKRQFRHGVLEYREFKWYCRVRGLEMQAGWFARSNSAIAGQLAERVHIERGWDSLDLRWGPPLVDAIFPADWHTPVALIPLEAAR